MHWGKLRGACFSCMSQRRLTVQLCIHALGVVRNDGGSGAWAGDALGCWRLQVGSFFGTEGRQAVDFLSFVLKLLTERCPKLVQVCVGNAVVDSMLEMNLEPGIAVGVQPAVSQL